MQYTEQALNRLRLMQAIGSRGPISRTELTEALQLSSATITDLTADLVRRGLIRERKETIRRGGRPRIQLEVNPEGGIVVGTSLAPDGTLSVTFSNLAGAVIHRWLGALHVETSIANFIAAVGDGLESAIASSALDRTALGRIAVGLPALIDSERGVIHWMATMPGEPVAAGAALERRIGVPVTVESGGIGMARAEHWFGRAREIPDFLLVHVDVTTTATQVTSGIPARGAHGLNMEFMHTKVDSVDTGRPCYCGSRGCLAAYCSMMGVMAAHGASDPASIRPDGKGLDGFHAIMKAALAGDPASLALFATAGEKLGIAIGNLVNITDPGHVIVLTTEGAFSTLIEPTLRRAFQRAAHPALLSLTPLDIGATIPDWEQLGMAALALEQTFLSGAGLSKGA